MWRDDDFKSKTPCYVVVVVDLFEQVEASLEFTVWNLESLIAPYHNSVQHMFPFSDNKIAVWCMSTRIGIIVYNNEDMWPCIGYPDPKAISSSLVDGGGVSYIHFDKIPEESHDPGLMSSTTSQGL
jgi:hypothetical protein